MKRDKDSSFHYHREERLAMPSAPDLSAHGRKGVFKGNRGLLILLFDILFICLMAFILKQFIFKPSYEADVEGCRVVLEAYRVNDGILTVVRIVKTGRSPFNRGGADQTRTASVDIEIRFTLSQEVKVVSGVLTSDTLDISASFPGSGEADQIEADVQIGEKAAHLVKDLPVRPH